MADPIVNEDSVIEDPQPTEEVTEVVPPGAKTDPALLLTELHKERDMRRDIQKELAQAQAELATLKDIPQAPEVFSEEGQSLKAEIQRLEKVVATGQRDAELVKLQSKFTALKDKEVEFNDFLSDPENAGMKLETAAKAFLAENNLVPVRKGLERESAGGRVPVKQGLTAEEVDDMRNNNYSEYRKRLKAGTLTIGQ